MGNLAVGESRNWGWLFPVIWCSLILLSSSIPDISTPAGLFARDKLVHLAEYCVLGVLIARGLSEAVRWSCLTRVLLVFAACVAFGILDEAYQCTIPGRASDRLDLVADCAGAAISQLAVVATEVRKGRL